MQALLAVLIGSPAAAALLGVSPPSRLAWLEGSIEVLERGQEDYAPLRARTPVRLRRGDRIRTDAKGRAILAFADRSVVEVSPNTVLLVDHDQPSFVSLVLIRGRIYASVSDRLERSFLVATPEATVEARSAELAVEAHDGGRTAVGVDFGLVTVTGPPERPGENRRLATLRGGQRADAAAGGGLRTETFAPRERSAR